MSDKKHIDELFKEQLQNFEAMPSDAVWNKIQAKMKKEKEDRKVIPIWWKLSGVAALLALLLTVGNFVFNDGEDPGSTEFVQEDPKVDDDSTQPVKLDDTNNQDAIAEEQQDDPSSVDSLNEEEEWLERKETFENEALESQNAVANANSVESESQKVVDKNSVTNTKTTEAKIKEAVATNETIDSKLPENKEDLDPLIKESQVAPTNEKIDTEVANTIDPSENQKKDQEPDNNALIKKDIELEGATNKKIETGVATETNNETKEEEKEKITNPENNKKSIFDAIEEEKEAAVAETKTPKDRAWEITPNVGPVFYNSLGEGSSIDPAFADNSQSGDVNFSYGVQVSYNLNDRLSIRSGVNNVNLGYSTGGVELATGPTALGLRSVDYGGRSVVLTAFDKGTIASLPPQGENDPFVNVRPKSGGGNAEIIQNLSYYEVPMELEYALLNRRFGINMIGGFSTLFLGDNEISVQDGTFRDVLGEANNLNSVSFSTNVGLGFDYKISKRLKFNLEPMFKYQLNPYSDSSVDFRPYYFGVYSGLSFKF